MSAKPTLEKLTELYLKEEKNVSCLNLLRGSTSGGWSETADLPTTVGQSRVDETAVLAAVVDSIGVAEYAAVGG